jgi:hypothetical protein
MATKLRFVASKSISSSPTVALDAAVFSLGEQISQCALNPGDVDPLFLSVSDPPTQADVQAIADRLDQLIGALKRV